ncbi:hypothetical protein PG987_007521 [Apiospora arundinis]
MPAKSRRVPSPASAIGVPAIAVVSGAFLSGAMTSLAAFAVPVLLDTNQDASHAVRQWARLYHYGHIYLPALCVATCGLYGFAAYQKKAANRSQWSRYALSAIITIAMVPFTWIFMAPTNNILFGLDASGSAGDLLFVRGLLVKWAWLHVTRSATPLLGAYLGFQTLVSEL